MRTFEIVDGERRAARPCALLFCDQVRGSFSVTVEPWAGPGDVPLAFSPFVERGEREVPERWVRAWVEERIAPPSRQNIGMVLRAHDLTDYDPLELLLSDEGRSTQDGFYLHEITKGHRNGARLGREIARARARSGLTQAELARKSGLRQDAISRLENGESNPTARTLEKLADALGARLVIAFEPLESPVG